MARPRKPARLKLWRSQWYVAFTDYSGLAPKEVRKSCAAAGALGSTARVELLKRYRLQEKLDSAEVVRRGGRVDFDASVMGSLDEFLADYERRAEVRASNPDARGGVSQKSLLLMTQSVRSFQDWLRRENLESLRTGHIDSNRLIRFFDFLTSQPAKGRRIDARRSSSTINGYRRNVKAAMRWINQVRPCRFPDFDCFAGAFRPMAEVVQPPTAFAPEALQGFLRCALAREDPQRTVSIVRFKIGGVPERFEQPATAHAATPVSRLFVLLALTGCRLGEALALRWSDVDLRRGRLTLQSIKTGRGRVVALSDAPELAIAPRFVDLLRAWRLQAGGREYVLPHEGVSQPLYPKSSWQMTVSAFDGPKIGPQLLRQNFTSYAASLGVPASVAALWQGHRADVAERHYRAQVLDRQSGDSIEAAMGLAEMVGEVQALREPRTQRA